MKMHIIFSKEEKEKLLKEFCKINDYSYYMVCKVMFENLLGREAAEDSFKTFCYFISGRLGINHEFIKFE